MCEEYRKNVRQRVYVPRTLAGNERKRCVHSSLPHFSLVLIKSCTLQTCQQGSVFIYTDGFEKREKKNGRKLDAK